MDLVTHFRRMARNNAWSNFRLLGACVQLTSEEFAAIRTSFFPSLQETLNHLLTVDWYYLDALECGGRGRSVFDNDIPFPNAADLRAAQEATDRRLILYCDRLTPDRLSEIVEIDRGDSGIDREIVADVLAHLFVHQIHHRGQAHAMLSGTAIPPPQLDEYFLAFDAERRAEDLQRLGITEAS